MRALKSRRFDLHRRHRRYCESVQAFRRLSTHSSERPTLILAQTNDGLEQDQPKKISNETQADRLHYPQWHPLKNRESVKRQTLAIASEAISTMIASSGVNDTYRMYLVAKRDGVDFNFASIGKDFALPYKRPFDEGYMRALYDYGYQKGRAGIFGKDRTHSGSDFTGGLALGRARSHSTTCAFTTRLCRLSNGRRLRPGNTSQWHSRTCRMSQLRSATSN